MATHPDYPGASSRMHRGKEMWRYRERGTNGKQTNLPGQPGDEEFEIAYHAAAGKPKAEIIDLPGRTVPHSFGHADRVMQEKAWWLKYDEKTRDLYRRKLDVFLDSEVDAEYKLKWRDVVISNARVKHVRNYINDAITSKSEHHAKHSLTAIRCLVRVALEAEWDDIEIDPTHTLKVKVTYQGHKAWPFEYMDRYERFHKIGTPARTAFALALWQGNRRSDVATIGWESLKSEVIELSDGSEVEVTAFEFNQRKNRNLNGGKRVFLKVIDQLEEVLAPLPRDTPAVLMSAYGKPYTIDGLGEQFRGWRRAAGIPEGYSLHGLRKSLGVYLAHIKASGRQLNDVLGHSNLQEAETYIRDANQKVLSTEALIKVEEAEARRRQRLKLKLAVNNG